ncbi:hypothetical protein [Thermopirellula anaerolimosa]
MINIALNSDKVLSFLLLAHFGGNDFLNPVYCGVATHVADGPRDYAGSDADRNRDPGSSFRRGKTGWRTSR